MKSHLCSLDKHPPYVLISYLSSSNLFHLHGHTVDTKWQDGWENGVREKDYICHNPQHGKRRWHFVCVRACVRACVCD